MTTRKTLSEKYNLCFTFECRNCSDLFNLSKRVPGLNFVLIELSSKRKYENLSVLVHVLQNTHSLVISRCCFAANGYEMYTLYYNSRAVSLFCSLSALFGCVVIAFVVCLSFLFTFQQNIWFIPFCTCAWPDVSSSFYKTQL